MRENIGLFKAKDIKTREWVYGYLNGFCYIESERYIKTGYNEQHEIDPETLCEFTGLTDKNGKKIWENDIVKCAIENPSTGKVEKYFNCIVSYCKTLNAMGWYGIDERKVLNKIPPQQDYVEIIGNKFDNPELLTKE